MIESTSSQNGFETAIPSIEGESILENLIEDCTNHLQAGDAIDVEEIAPVIRSRPSGSAGSCRRSR